MINKGNTMSEKKADNTRRIVISITFGDYTVSMMDQDSFWLHNRDGEGMQVYNHEFAAMLDKHFKDNF